MAGGNLKRPITTDTQTRCKKTKTRSLRDAPEQNPRSELRETQIDPADLDFEDFEDFEDDPGSWNPFTSQLNKVLEQVKKPDHWPRDFAKGVKERQRTLLEELQVKCQAMTAGQQRFTSQFHHIIATALAPVGAEPSSASHPLHIVHVAPDGQPLYDKCSILLEESKKLLAQYDELVAPQHSETSRLEDVSNTFAIDKDHTARAIAAGRRVADTDIDDMLADKMQEVRGRKAIPADDETLGREILQVGQNLRPEPAELDTEGWGEVAHRAQRAFEKLYRVTVMEE